MRRQTSARYAVPWVKTSCVILGEAQIETFEAMCAIAGRRPHQLVADVVLDAIRGGQSDHDVQALVVHSRNSRKRYDVRRADDRRGLRLLGGGRG